MISMRFHEFFRLNFEFNTEMRQKNSFVGHKLIIHIYFYINFVEKRRKSKRVGNEAKDIHCRLSRKRERERKLFLHHHRKT